MEKCPLTFRSPIQARKREDKRDTSPLYNGISTEKVPSLLTFVSASFSMGVISVLCSVFIG